MNGTSRLYRSTSEAMLGGVAAGLANYFKIDPVIVRAAFVILTFLTGGAFAIVYVALWLLVPTAGSTSTSPGEVMQENLNDLGARFRSFTGTPSAGSGPATTPTNGAPNGNGGNGGNGTPAGNNIAPYQAGAAPRPGIGPIFLIGLGAFFLLSHLGFFHAIRWGFWWPVLLIGLGVMMLMRRNR